MLPPLPDLKLVFSQQELKVRLRSGAQMGEGRVEVLMNHQWGTVCDHGWNLISASIVCRQLGFGSAREALFGAQLGQGKRGGLGWGVGGCGWATVPSLGGPGAEAQDRKFSPTMGEVKGGRVLEAELYLAPPHLPARLGTHPPARGTLQGF